MKVAQSCPTLCDPMDYTVHGILQARILEWVAFPFSRGSSQPRDQTQVSCIAGRFFTNWAIREANMLHRYLQSPIYITLILNSQVKKLSLTELKLLAVGEWLEFGFPDLIKEREWKNGEEVSFFCFVLFLFEWYYHLKNEHWRIDAFELWCWRRLLRVPWTVRRSNQSILKEISPGCSLVGLMLKLKL